MSADSNARFKAHNERKVAGVDSETPIKKYLLEAYTGFEGDGENDYFVFCDTTLPSSIFSPSERLDFHLFRKGPDFKDLTEADVTKPIYDKIIDTERPTNKEYPPIFVEAKDKKSGKSQKIHKLVSTPLKEERTNKIHRSIYGPGGSLEIKGPVGEKYDRTKGNKYEYGNIWVPRNKVVGYGGYKTMVSRYGPDIQAYTIMRYLDDDDEPVDIVARITPRWETLHQEGQGRSFKNSVTDTIEVPIFYFSKIDLALYKGDLDDLFRANDQPVKPVKLTKKAEYETDREVTNDLRSAGVAKTASPLLQETNKNVLTHSLQQLISSAKRAQVKKRLHSAVVNLHKERENMRAGATGDDVRDLFRK
jgi:hypothetical protein